MHQIRLFLCTGSADHVGNGRMICARVDVNGFCKGDLGDPLVLKVLGTVYSSIASIHIIIIFLPSCTFMILEKQYRTLVGLANLGMVIPMVASSWTGSTHSQTKNQN